MGTIADFTPHTAPVVPSLIVHFINEVECHGLNDTGIYKEPGAEKDVRLLKGRFLHGKSVPNLSWMDIHTICDTTKDFLCYVPL
jgi:Rac GTPase-activating protein 1